MEHTQHYKNLEDIRKGPHSFVNGSYVTVPPNFTAYPKWKYHPTKQALVVPDAEAEEALGEGWYDTKPAAEAAKLAKPELESTDDVQSEPKKRGPKPKVTE